MNDTIHVYTRLQKQIIKELKDGAKTRDQLVKVLGVPRTTIYDALRKLIKYDRVIKYPLYNYERIKGRPKILFSLIDNG